MIRYRIVHTTEYRFSETAHHCRLAVMLTPRDGDGQRVAHCQIITRPMGEVIARGTDAFGNRLTDIVIAEPLKRLVLSANSTVIVARPEKQTGAGMNSGDPTVHLAPSGLVSLSPQIAGFARSFAHETEDPVALAEKLALHVKANFAFQAGATHVGTTADEVLSLGRGVCQDFAHLSIAVLRSLGIPARYVSGYIYTAAFRGAAHRPAADLSHAWFEVFDRQAGWIGFDPANGRRVDHHYIAVAHGRDYNDVCALKGRCKDGGAHTLHVAVDVQRIDSPGPGQ